MYCRKCGNKCEDNARFCSNCGSTLDDSQVINNVSFNNGSYVPTEDEKKKKRNLIIVIIVLICISVIIPIIIIVGIFIMVNKTIKNEFIDIGNINVYSFFHYSESAKMCGFYSETENANTVITIKVCEYDNFKKDADKYIEYMIEEYGYEEIDSTYYRTIIIPDLTDRYVIEVNLDLDEHSIIYKRYHSSEINNSQEDNLDMDNNNDIIEENDETSDENYKAIEEYPSDSVNLSQDLIENI